MGYFREDRPGHEGYAVGFVTRESTGIRSGLYRELAYPDDAGPRRVELLAAGCDCGWRSPRFTPSSPPTWAPYSVGTCEADDDRVRRLWCQHMEAS
jgi:hypothetical protein